MFATMLKLRYIIILLTIICYACADKKMTEGNKLVDKIESYRVLNHKLPYSLADLGIKETEEGPLYYQKKDSVNYIVWYGTSLGESTTYNSQTKTWSEQ